MKKGTKSLLFGVHAFWIHPILVYYAWWKQKGRFPGWRELICTIIHDWGYWGCENMDDEKGDSHPELGAKIANRFFGAEYADMVRFHSRHHARKFNAKPSELCWADKQSILYEWWWFYLPRAWLSGELQEYREISDKAGFIKMNQSHRTWFYWIQSRFKKAVKTQNRETVIDTQDIKASQ